MEPTLKDRIIRRLDQMSDERGFQVLDYVEFLESKYAARSNPDNFFSRITDTVQDTMRAGKIPIQAISGTVGIFDGASKVMKGVAAAAASVVDEASRTARSITSPAPAATPPQAAAAPPSSPPVPPTPAPPVTPPPAPEGPGKVADGS